MNKSATLFFLLVLNTFVSGAPVEHWFEQGNAAYSNGQFDSAASYYQRIIESGTNNAAVLYNYGNSLFRLKKTGEARLAYEKAACLSPGDADIQANIKFIRSTIVDRVPEPERSFLDTILWKLHIFLPLKNQIWAALFLWSLLALFIGMFFFAAGNLRLWLIYLSVLTVLFLTVTGTSIGIKINESENISYAIVLDSSTDAKNEPNGSTTLFTAHEGIKIRIRKKNAGWALVSLPNGVSGWVELKSLGII